MNLQTKVDELKQFKKIHGLSENISEHEITQLSIGMPIQKIIGFINFDNLQINVNRYVLIPRYETQEVVNFALQYVKQDSKVLDLCAGSGYIGLTIVQKTKANVTLADISEHAIKQIEENSKLNNLKVNIVLSNLFENIHEKFDLIICNPPYIPAGMKLNKSVTNFEPAVALFAGVDGNDYYRQIIPMLKKHLNKNAHVVFEISPENKDYLVKEGFQIFNDINGKARIAFQKM